MTEELKLFSLEQVSIKIGMSNYQEHKLKALIDNPEIHTPPAAFIVNGKDMWTEDTFVDWKALWDKTTQKERELEEERLNSETLKKSSIVEFLLKEVKELERLNSRCYTHNRGNSMSDGRRRILEFEGVHKFVDVLMGDLKIPKEKQVEINELYQKAKDHVKVQ